MSRYDELCQSCEVMFKNYYDHKDRVYEFLRHRFVAGLRRFLECSEDKVRILDWNSGSRSLSLYEAMQPDADC